MGAESFIAQQFGGSYEATRTRIMLRVRWGLSGFSAANFLSWDGAAVGDIEMPYLLSAFGVRGDAENGSLVRVQVDSGSGQDIRVRTNNNASATSEENGIFSHASNQNPALGEVFYLAGAFISSSSRRSWLEGNLVTDVAARPIAGAAQSIRVGAASNLTAAWPGEIFRVSIWNLAGMADPAITALVGMLRRGAHPLSVESEGAGTIYVLGGRKAFADLPAVGPWSVEGVLAMFDANPNAIVAHGVDGSSHIDPGRWAIN